MEQEEFKKLDLSSLGSFDFTPTWAREEAHATIDAKPARNGEGRSERNSDRKPEDGERRQFGERKPFGERKQFGERKPFAKKSFDRPRQLAEKPKPLDAEVKILPETKALGTIIRKLQGDAHAFKLKDLAYFFLDNPSSVLLKITPKGEEKFFQCKACGFASTKQEDVMEHIVTVHLGDYYDSKEVEVEPPKGNFNCVARCGLSGVLLGPPNIHEFNAVVKEMIRTKYPDMSEEQYRSHIEMVRDADTIEEWRKGATKQMRFFAKGTMDTEGAASCTREQAEGEFKRNYLSAMIDSPKNLMITAEMAMKSPVKPLQWAVHDALQAEHRAPYSMIFALRGAFHHRKLKFFRANDARGPEFVINVELKEFDAAHAIPELRAASEFLMANPCLDKSEFPSDIADFEKQLNWLVSTGHAVAFTNGVYSAVEKFPKYGPQWKKRASKTKTEVKADEKAEEVKAEEPKVEEEKQNETTAILAE